jgi:transcriptional regulator with XRE-family HTH domain
MGFAERVKQARKIREISAARLSLDAGLARAHVSVIESRPGRRVWPETAEALARVLCCDASWLLFGHGRAPVKATRIKRARKAA